MEHFYYRIGEDWMDFQDLYSRMVNTFPDGSHFVEVGCWKGRSASFMGVEIKNSGRRIDFDCIDTWKGSIEHTDPNSPYYEIGLIDNEDFVYQEFIKNVKPVIDVINPIRLPSTDASNLYRNRSLDFVFIDASHEYSDVKRDILSWLPKVKIGGFLAGHDYTTFDGVKKAVDEFFIDDNISLEKSYWIYYKNK